MDTAAVIVGIFAITFVSGFWIFHMVRDWIWMDVVSDSFIEFIITKKKNKELREKKWVKSSAYTFLGLTIMTMNGLTFFFALMKTNVTEILPAEKRIFMINGGVALVIFVVLLGRFLIKRRRRSDAWKKITRNMCICAIVSLMISMSAYVLL